MENEKSEKLGEVKRSSITPWKTEILSLQGNVGASEVLQFVSGLSVNKSPKSNENKIFPHFLFSKIQYLKYHYINTLVRILSRDRWSNQMR